MLRDGGVGGGQNEDQKHQQQQAPALLLVFARFFWTERVALLLILFVLLAQYGYWQSTSDKTQVALRREWRDASGTEDESQDSSGTET
ncbi:hypothetical protein GPALN_009765 [Globodera pallida]|nr:hypothetical protein GPALN_009765 [Globodera pallida]